MMTQLAIYPAYAYPGGYGHGVGGPGWWLIFPIVFWALVLSVGVYAIYAGHRGSRREPQPSGRWLSATSAARSARRSYGSAGMRSEPGSGGRRGRTVVACRCATGGNFWPKVAASGTPVTDPLCLSVVKGAYVEASSPVFTPG
jgi:putative membrane protein